MAATLTPATTNVKVGDPIVVSGAGMGTAASLTTACAGSNNDIKYTAVVPGTGGNAITVAYVVSGNNTALSVGVSSSAITVTVATDGGGAATSTAALVLAAVLASAPASALVSAALATGNDGTGVVAAFGAANLTSGASPNVELEFIHELNTEADVRYTEALSATGTVTNSASELTYKPEAPGIVKINARIASVIVASTIVHVKTVS